jgi:hypothetical protein
MPFSRWSFSRRRSFAVSSSFNSLISSSFASSLLAIDVVSCGLYKVADSGRPLVPTALVEKLAELNEVRDNVGSRDIAVSLSSVPEEPLRLSYRYSISILSCFMTGICTGEGGHEGAGK